VGFIYNESTKRRDQTPFHDTKFTAILRDNVMTLKEDGKEEVYRCEAPWRTYCPPRATRSISSRTRRSTNVGRLLSSHSCSIGRSISSAISSNERRRLAANASESSPNAAETWRCVVSERRAGRAPEIVVSPPGAEFGAAATTGCACGAAACGAETASTAFCTSTSVSSSAES